MRAEAINRLKPSGAAASGGGGAVAETMWGIGLPLQSVLARVDTSDVPTTSVEDTVAPCTTQSTAPATGVAYAAVGGTSPVACGPSVVTNVVGS